ncbi:transmembrane protease serine 4a isoform X1 [Xiphophorus hellerii]|uniref:transmembrane protease serine 4a isoform X1 n=2 Tax=Xiphophorus hellerii TaxID=8084 RepID=UPI0013B3E2F0|nr:transmembrane protease serine 4-like isoform X1 [Xiphophorus hellerii]
MGKSQSSIQEPADIDIPLNPRMPTVPQQAVCKKPMTNSTPQIEKALKRRKILIWILIAVVILGILVTAGYFVKKLIESNYYYCTRSAKFIPIAKSCDGNIDCVYGEDEVYCSTEFKANDTFPVRLISAERVLQVFNGKTWVTVCNDDWSTQHTETACKQLGYTNSPTSKNVYVSSLPFPLKTGPFTAVRIGSGSTPVHQATIDRSVCRTGSVVSLTCSDCGVGGNLERIVGGVDAHIEEYPWQVSLQNGGHRCGGSLVSSRWIVTAAHCFSGNKELSRWTVMSGETYLTTLGGSSVDKIIIHDQYDEASSDYDLAMMRLSSPISVGDKRKPVCLPPKDLLLPDKAPVVVSGWGLLRENGKISTTLQKANIEMIDRNTCSSIYATMLSQRMVCAGNLKGGVDSCQGDSGGPLVYLSASQWYLVGVVSWGDGCARENRPGVYSNVDNMLNWIYAAIEKNP